jgi:hypothetical protein
MGHARGFVTLIPGAKRVMLLYVERHQAGGPNSGFPKIRFLIEIGAGCLTFL